MSEYLKYIRDGYAAVLYSPTSTKGWYTSNKRNPGMAFDSNLVTRILDGDFVGVRKLAEARYPEVYCGESVNLQVAWLPVGTVFDIETSNGKETLHIYGQITHLVA